MLHVALLLRLPLIDRHLPRFPSSVKFSSVCARFLEQFQSRLASNVCSSLSTLSWSKISDVFDGRLFAFTLEQVNRSLTSKISFDSATMTILEKCLHLLNISSNATVLPDALRQLIQLEHITFPSSLSSSDVSDNPIEHKPLTKIRNRFIDTHLQPILSSKIASALNFVAPNNSPSIRYEG